MRAVAEGISPLEGLALGRAEAALQLAAMPKPFDVKEARESILRIA
jgi:hypothetical protein